MTVFRRTATSLLSPAERKFAEAIAEQMWMRNGVRVSASERRSWERSLPVVAEDLVEAGLGEVEMLIEYRLPLTSKRADVVPAGVDRRTGGDAYVVVELKQWSRAEVWEDDPRRVLVHSMGGEPRLHPALRAKGCCDHLLGFATVLADHPDAVHAVAYLHNAQRGDVLDLYDTVKDDRTRLFTQSLRGLPARPVRRRARRAGGRPAAVQRRASLQAVAEGRRRGDQEPGAVRAARRTAPGLRTGLARELVWHAVDKARREDVKTIVVVKGGPGSGKSVIALAAAAAGTRKYEEWVLRLLGLDGGTPEPWQGDDHFEVTPADSPHELESLLCSRLDGGDSARMTAGFCWPWSDPRDGRLISDVVIGGWARPWNVKGDRAVGDAPPSELWAAQDGGFGQVGCVYTAQGFEYDWNGVVLGPDLVHRDGRLVTVRAESKDPALRPRTVSDEDAGRLIRNTYKVLLTRGMKGTLLYSADPPTQAFLATLLA